MEFGDINASPMSLGFTMNFRQVIDSLTGHTPVVVVTGTGANAWVHDSVNEVLYVASGSTLVSFDVSAPATPVVLDTLVDSDYAQIRYLGLNDGVLYATRYSVNASTNWLISFDISNPAVLSELDRVTGPFAGFNQSISVFFAGDYAFIFSLNAGAAVAIIDISVPSAMVYEGVRGTMPVGVYGTGWQFIQDADGYVLHADGDYAFANAFEMDGVTWGNSQHGTPAAAAGGSGFTAVALAKDTLFALRDDYVESFDASDPMNMSALGSVFDANIGKGRDINQAIMSLHIVVCGDIVVASEYGSGSGSPDTVAVIDAANPSAMTVESEPTLSGVGPVAMLSHFGYMFATHVAGMDVWDVQSAPSSPTLIDTFALAVPGLHIVGTSGSFIWVFQVNALVPVEIIFA